MISDQFNIPSGPVLGVHLTFPGRSTVEVVTFVPFEAFASWRDTKWKRRGAAYDSLKQSLAARLQAALERHVPTVAGRVDYAELSTPVTTRHFMNYEKGEIYGISSTPARFGMRVVGARTPIRDLYLTGQDVASLGVVGALFGGVICASAVLKKNLISRPEFQSISIAWDSHETT